MTDTWLEIGREMDFVDERFPSSLLRDKQWPERLIIEIQQIIDETDFEYEYPNPTNFRFALTCNPDEVKDYDIAKLGSYKESYDTTIYTGFSIKTPGSRKPKTANILFGFDYGEEYENNIIT